VSKINSLVRKIIEYYSKEKIEKDVGVELLKIIKEEGLHRAKDIAVIGIGLRLPGADDANEFWINLKNGVDSIRTFPENRKKDIEYFIKSYSGAKTEDAQFPEGGYLNEIDKFDYKFFRLSPNEASLMDPNQRLFLQTAFEAIEDAGYGNDKLKGSNTGVYVGCGSFPVYGQFVSKVMPSQYSMSFAGNVTPIISSRIGYFLDFHGPSMLIDTACSSSLVAVHLACNAIKNGDCDQAIAGGISINLMPVKRAGHIGIESEDYRTRTFDFNSTGTAFGEGVIAVLLKPLEKALLDKDNIYGVIKGSAINQDGNSVGITAPNVLAQTDVILKAWSDAKINPESISYIECHGTGTKLGDPIEFEGIKGAFKKYTDKKQICGIGSVKTNIGHLDNAAGLAGMIKALLVLKNREIPPILHYKRPNVAIDFPDSPLYVCDKIKRWYVDDEPKRCGVSSFGISGTNCHVILEEWIQKEKVQLYKGTFNILAISAVSEKQLRELIEKYYRALSDLPEADFNDFCYSVNTGRGHYKHRLAIISQDKNDLLQKLYDFQFIDIKQTVSNEWFYGEHLIVPENKESFLKFEVTLRKISELSEMADAKIAQLLDSIKGDRHQLGNLCKLYIEGAKINWDAIYSEDGLFKVSVPVYPFEKNRCWLDEKEFEITTSDFGGFYNGLQDESQFDAAACIIEYAMQKETDKSNVVLIGRADGNYTQVEKTVAQAWAEVLGMTEIGIYDNYFEIGGDSISAVRIVNRLNGTNDYNIGVQNIFQYLNISSLAKYLKDSIQQNEVYPPMIKLPQKEYYQLSSAQKRIFVLHNLNPDSLSYNLPSAMTIKGKLDAVKLEKALVALIRRHEVLRTSFCLIDGEPKQKVNDDFKFVMSTHKLVEENIQQTICEFIKPFSLLAPPLMRACLLCLEAERHILLLDFHHIVFDGYSMDVFIKEITALYDGMELEKLTLQYKDYAEWQISLMDMNVLKKQEEFWVNVFSTPVRPLDLPIDYPRSNGTQVLEGAVFAFEIDKMLAKRIKVLIRDHGVTLYIFLLAIYNVLLSKYCNQEDIVVGSPVSGRTQIDTEYIIGMFVNMVSMRNNPKGDKEFVSFLGEVRQSAIEAFNNQDFQFDTLIKHLNLNSNLNRNPLFDTTFVLQNTGNAEIKIENLEFRSFDIQNRDTPFELVWEAIERDERIYFTVRYASNLYKYETIERLCSNYIGIIEQVTKRMNIKLIDISVEGNMALKDHDMDMSKIQDIDFDF